MEIMVWARLELAFIYVAAIDRFLPPYYIFFSIES